MISNHLRAAGAGLAAAILVLLVISLAPGEASSSGEPNKMSRAGVSTSLDSYTLWLTPEWKKRPWQKKGKRIGWRLYYQPEGVAYKQIRLSISLAGKPKTGATAQKAKALEERLPKVLQESYPDGFMSGNMALAGSRALYVRYFVKDSTIFIFFPRRGNRLYDIYVWARGRVEKLPLEARNLLDTLRLPGQAPYQPASAGKESAPRPVTAKPISPSPSVSPGAAGGSQVAGVCYLAKQAAEGEVLGLSLGMPLAQVEKRHKVMPYTQGSYRLWEDQNPCLAKYEYHLAKKGFEKKTTSFAAVFGVNSKDPAKPLTSITAKIVCEPGMEVSRRIFAWYERTYGPPWKKTNRMDGTMKLGSRVVPAEFWHTWLLRGTGGRGFILEIKRRNNFAYYTITVKDQ